MGPYRSFREGFHCRPGGRCGSRVQANAAVRGRTAEPIDLIAAMDCMGTPQLSSNW
jgi:hypothetical protein